jgi:alpha-tubulin suppressor-like RCC1 family protein
MEPLVKIAAAILAVVVLAPAPAVATGARAGAKATSISATDGHTCASMSGGAVECWGRSYLPETQSNVPVPMAGIRGAASVQASIRYNCALLRSGRVQCWGDNGYGQLGNRKTRDSGVPVKVVGVTRAIAISTGGYHACALLATGTVECWGHNLRGALGNGSLKDSSVPVQVRGISDAVAISAGYIDDETCAVRDTGAVACWGANGQGQLGNGTLADSATPVAVIGVTNAVGVAASGGHACAVLATGQVECWGNNIEGQLGNGTRTTSLLPVPVVGISDASAVAVDPRGYSCAVVRTGAVYCWGHNPKDQLGNGRQPEGSLTPVRALNISDAVAITTGIGHACALLSSGRADCWGHDDYGQLGKGGGPPANSDPVPVLFPSTPRTGARAPVGDRQGDGPTCRRVVCHNKLSASSWRHIQAAATM